MNKLLLLLALFSTLKIECQTYVCPLTYDETEKSFAKVNNYINRNILKSIIAYECNDSATIDILTKYAWEAFYNLNTAQDTVLVKQLSLGSSNILKYQSVWSQYFHIKKSKTYVYADRKDIGYKFLVELSVETEE